MFFFNLTDPNLPQHTYPTDASHASLLFAANPGVAIPPQIQGAPFAGMFQGATAQPSPYESSHLPPGVSPVPNGVSPVVLPGLSLSSNQAASDTGLVAQAGTIDPQPATYPAPVSEETYTQVTKLLIVTEMKSHIFFSI